jgi:hypothetical protein
VLFIQLIALCDERLMICLAVDHVNDGFDNFLEDFGAHQDSYYAITPHGRFEGGG